MMANLLGVFFSSQQKKTYLLVDEAHLLADTTIESILTEARKRNLYLIAASQSISQFSKGVKHRLLTNVGVHIVGRHYDVDTNELIRSMNISIKEIQSLKNYHFITKVEETTPMTIKSPKWLLGKSRKMIRSKEAMEQLKQQQLQQYYEPTGEIKDDNITYKVEVTLQPKFSS